MSSETESFIPQTLVAITVLVGAASGLVAVLGNGLRVAQVSNWELVMQVGYVGLTLSVVVGAGMGVVWAVRVLTRSIRGDARGETDRGGEPDSAGR